MDEFKRVVNELLQSKLNDLNAIANGKMSLSQAQQRLQYVIDNLKEFSKDLTALSNHYFKYDEMNDTQRAEVQNVVKDAVETFIHSGSPKIG